MLRQVLLGVLLFVATTVRADSLACARLARTLLGPGVWSRVLRIENRRSDPAHPLDFHALVFALEDRLWLYHSNEGTQSLSIYAGRLEQDEANLAPLLHAVLPDLTGFQDVTEQVNGRALGPEWPPPLRRPGDTLPFGCFIECLARWRELQAGPAPPEEAGVLAFYFDTGTGPHGHSVLVYRQNRLRYCYDPAAGETFEMESSTPTGTPLELARGLNPMQTPFKAHLLALHRPAAAAPVAVAKIATEATGS